MMVVPVDGVQRQEQGSVMRCGIQVADYEYVQEKTKTEYQVKLRKSARRNTTALFSTLVNL